MADKKIVFNDLTYTLDEKTGYYLNSTIRKRLHRSIWEHHKGAIPEGFHIHHADGNKRNNDIENLELMSAKEHLYLHGKQIENIEKMRRIQVEGRMKAGIWHKSEEGSEWHKKHYENTKDRMNEKQEFKCERCGSEFEAVNRGVNRFCSNKCKAAARRDSGVDDVARDCNHCGKRFTINKYKKTVFCSKSCSNKAVKRLPQLKNKDAL